MRPAPFRSLLAATDLSESSDVVLRTAGELARYAGARLHVVHAYDFPPAPYVEHGDAVLGFPDQIRDAEQALEAQIRRTVPEEVEVTSEVIIYTPHRAIADRARDRLADLIVLGPHARGQGIPMLGTTADRVLRTADVPCLVVRGTLPLPLGRVVVPLDLSQPAQGALDAALAWAESLGPVDGGSAEVRVVHVLPRSFGGTGMEAGRARVGPDLHQAVEEAVRVAGAAGDVSVREEMIWGERTAPEIVRYAEAEQADLVVLATHGYGAVKRALLGSVAGAVARDAHCSVLLVPPAQWDGE